MQLIGSQNLCVEFKLDECRVLFTDILTCNVERDNDGCYDKFGSLARHIKNVFLPILTERWKLMNAAHYELKKYSIDRACMVYDKVNRS